MKNTDSLPSLTQEETVPAPIGAENLYHGKKTGRIAEGFRNHTRGEALFNKISYFGFGYVLTTAVSVAMTWLLNDRYAAKFDTFKAGLKTSKYISRFGKMQGFDSAVEIGTLFLGGTLASVFPVKLLENSKVALVKKFDHFYYSDQEIANDPAIHHAYKMLEAEPKQTWSSVFSSRVVAFVATFSIFGLMGSNASPLKKATDKSIDSLSMQAGRAMDKVFSGEKAAVSIGEAIAANETAMAATAHLPMGHPQKIAGMQVLRDSTYGASDRVPSRVWNYLVKDGFYTIITSATLFVFTRILGPVFGKKTVALEKDTLVVAPVPTASPQLQERQPEPTHQPRTSVSQTTHQQRVTPALHEPQLTA